MATRNTIYRVLAHDTTYPISSPRYYVARSAEQLRAELERDHEGTIVIEAIVEVTLQEVVNQLNFYIA